MPSSFMRSVRGDIRFELPPTWRLSTTAAFEESDNKPDVEACFTQAMTNPIDTPALRRLLAPGDRIAVLIEDLTRSSPKKIILKCLLDSLAKIGIAPEDIRIVISLGTHRGLSQKELENAFGQSIAQAYTFINHDCHAADLVPVGKLKTGATVKINRQVYESDFRIGIGSIFPHPMNGFGGGGKILFPGVADFESIFEHHLHHSFRGQAYLGNLEDNSFYAEVCELAIAGKLDFIINSVLDHNDQLYDLVCGHPVIAHEAGTQICKRIISQTFATSTDITLISAFPYTEGPQIMKPLAPAGLITRKGGTIILHADCSVPLPKIYFETCEAFRAKNSGRIGPAVLEHFADQRPIIPGSPPELNMSLAQCLLALNDHTVILVTTDIPKHNVHRLGFGFADSMDAAIGMAAAGGPRPSVNIVPSGGVILPLITEKMA